MIRTIFLSLEDVETICYKYAKAHLEYDEPLPSFDSRFPGKLESVLAVPMRTYQEKFLYNTLAKKAAVLFYEMIKMHPFFNGNKRIACVSLLVFLNFNNTWMTVGWEDFYKIAMAVATSNIKERELILTRLEKFIDLGIKIYEGKNKK